MTAQPVTAHTTAQRVTATSGVRAIVGYKTVKSCIQLALTLLLCILWPLGLPDKLQGQASWLHHHLTQAWAQHLADVLASDTGHRRLQLGLLALGLDGTLTGIEAWSLRGGHWWGPWLVVVASGALLPFEVYELVRAPRWSSALIFGINVSIMGYLARRAWLERKAPSQRLSP